MSVAVVRVASMDGCQHMVGYHATSTHLAAPPIHPFRETVEGWVSFHPTRPGGQTQGRMPLCGKITPTYTHPAASPTPQGSIAICRVSSPRTHGGPRAAFSGHGNSPPTPTHHARPLVSALPPRCTIHRILHRKSWPPTHREPAHVPRCAACHSCTSTVVYRSKHVVQVAEGVEWIVFRVGSTAMVVKRKTRNISPGWVLVRGPLQKKHVGGYGCTGRLALHWRGALLKPRRV